MLRFILPLAVFFAVSLYAEDAKKDAAPTPAKESDAAHKPTIRLKKMCSVVLYVSDLEKSKAFYTDHLGLEFSEKMGDGILMKGAGIQFFIEGGHAKREKVSGKEAEVSVTFEAEGGVRHAFEKLQKAGVTIIRKYQEVAPDFAFFRMADPDGNVFEIAGEP